MRLRPFLLVTSLLWLAGCETMGNRFSAVPPKVQVFNGDRFAVHAAALQAFKRLDFLVTRSKPMDIEAVSRIHTSVAFADSRQLAVKLHLNEAGPDGTELEMSVTEQVQGERMGDTSQLTMREHGFFQLYFATLQQVLEENAIGRSSEKN